MPWRSPLLQVRRSRTKDYLTAHAWWSQHRITMTVPLSWTVDRDDRHRIEADLLVTVLHELAHLFAPAGAMHDERFNAQLLRAAMAIWGGDVAGGIGVTKGYGPTEALTIRLAARLANEDH